MHTRLPSYHVWLLQGLQNKDKALNVVMRPNESAVIIICKIGLVHAGLQPSQVL